MSPTPRPWIYRVMTHLPAPPDWYLPVCMLVGCLALGFTIGMLFCGAQLPRADLEGLNAATLSSRLQTLEQRVKALEETR